MIKRLLYLTFILFFTTQSELLAQTIGAGLSVDYLNSGITHSTQPNKQFFLVTTQTGSLKGKTADLKAAFSSNQFASVDINELTSTLKITSYKGTKIEDVKAILVRFHLAIIDYEEEYTNTYPSIFLNH